MRPDKVGLDFPHVLRALWTLSIMGSQGDLRLVLFPIQAPRDLTESLSLAILIRSFRGVWLFWCILQFVIISDLCSVELRGMISVLSILNFVPDARHHSSRMSCTWSIRSFLPRKRLVSSANIDTMIFSSMPAIFSPSRAGSSLNLQARGSIARLKRAQDRGSPCWTPRVTWNGWLSMPLIATRVCALLYSDFMVLMKVCGIWNLSSIAHR